MVILNIGVIISETMGSNPARRLQEAGKKRGEQTGPSPVDRAKCGTALQLACDGRAMPLGVIVTPANANDGCHARELLAALVVPPPAPTLPRVELDVRSLPTAQADGAYGNRPTRARAKLAGVRLHAPSRGQRRLGIGRILKRWNAATISSRSSGESAAAWIDPPNIS